MGELEAWRDDVGGWAPSEIDDVLSEVLASGVAPKRSKREDEVEALLDRIGPALANRESGLLKDLVREFWPDARTVNERQRCRSLLAEVLEDLGWRRPLQGETKVWRKAA